MLCSQNQKQGQSGNTTRRKRASLHIKWMEIGLLMGYMSIPSQNFTVENLDTSLRFTFRYRDEDFSTIMVCIGGVLYLAGLIYFGMFFLSNYWQILNHSFSTNISDTVFSGLFFLIIFSVQGATIFIEIFWRLMGTEIVEVNGNGVSIRHQVLRFGITKRFSAEKISCIFISQRKDHWIFTTSGKEMRYLNFKRGKIGFNNGKTFLGEINTQRFGSVLDPDETRQVLAIIHEKYPLYRCAAKRTNLSRTV